MITTVPQHIAGIETVETGWECVMHVIAQIVAYFFCLMATQKSVTITLLLYGISLSDFTIIIIINNRFRALK